MDKKNTHKGPQATAKDGSEPQTTTHATIYDQILSACFTSLYQTLEGLSKAF